MNKKIMPSEFNNLQSDWLNQAEELNDTEAAQVNGGGISGAAGVPSVPFAPSAPSAPSPERY